MLFFRLVIPFSGFITSLPFLFVIVRLYNGFLRYTTLNILQIISDNPSKLCEKSQLRFKPDNNLAEQFIRPVTLSKKNFLFVGSERGGETAAIFMSLIATCKANKINPFEYLKDVLSRINSHPHKKLAELLPQNWKPLQK